MRKISKLLAATMALTLAFGMTVCAAPSTNTNNTNATTEALASRVETADSNVAIVAVDEADYNEAEIKADDAALIGEEGTTYIVAAVDLNLNGVEISRENPYTFTLNVDVVKANKKYVVLHKRTSDNGWERVNATVNKDGEIQFTLTSLSPVFVVEVVEKAGDANGAAADTTADTAADTAADAAVSPKTGEVASVAGIMAVICLAGAAVSAKKVRYNK